MASVRTVRTVVGPGAREAAPDQLRADLAGLVLGQDMERVEVPDVVAQRGVGRRDHPAVGFGHPEPVGIVADAEVAEPDDPFGRQRRGHRPAGPAVQLAGRFLDDLEGPLGVLGPGAAIGDRFLARDRPSGRTAGSVAVHRRGDRPPLWPGRQRADERVEVHHELERDLDHVGLGPLDERMPVALRFLALDVPVAEALGPVAVGLLAGDLVQERAAPAALADRGGT